MLSVGQKTCTDSAQAFTQQSHFERNLFIVPSQAPRHHQRPGERSSVSGCFCLQGSVHWTRAHTGQTAFYMKQHYVIPHVVLCYIISTFGCIRSGFHRLIRSCFSAASSGCVHPGHHDGRTGGDGFRGPAAEPAAAEEVQLQPAGRGQRARSDD